jgi:hypothetical protein
MSFKTKYVYLANIPAAIRNSGDAIQDITIAIILSAEITNSVEQSLPCKAIVARLAQNPAFYGNRKFITVFTGSHHRFLSSVVTEFAFSDCKNRKCE